MKTWVFSLCCALLMFACPGANAATPAVEPHVVVLVYHRFALTVDSAMTVRMQTFEAHLHAIEAAGYRIVPLADILRWHEGEQDALPAKAVAITVDDGHRSVFETLWPALRGRGIPVTLFVYPSAISNAAYAMNWPQLRELARTGQFDVQSHTYWHPNFRVERMHRSADDFVKFAHDQLRRAKVRIETEIGVPVHLLAWPFGIHDPELERFAQEEGYSAAFTLDAQPLRASQPALALPRFLITDGCGARCMTNILNAAGATHE
ncbi:polysaccharide deacetylase family protein [Ralstonia mojiangensis]|uniref:polysaccharide deacetylase family protein n=1 Tax=Ralstonia mojiangensis TaxID=2953895 RepID=UPI0021B3AB8F|nr:polysaccharide deacetylase family protein [Ralstonia mojiangensis]MCT7329367.1 polysaccharide deacetylase family protein [Ralstonia mojiangensis]